VGGFVRSSFPKAASFHFLSLSVVLQLFFFAMHVAILSMVLGCQ
jgi:hypothetical protein